MKRLKHLLFLSVLALSCSQQAHAVKAFPKPIRVVQPDGTTLMVQLVGDEGSHYTTTLDGFMIQKNREGFFCYVAYDADKGQRTVTSQRVHPVKERNADEKALVSGLMKGREISKDEHQRFGRKVLQPQQLLSPKVLNPQRRAKVSEQRSVESHYLVVLVNFADSTFRFTHDDFDAWLNEEGYSKNGATGSVRDYYADNSMQQYVPNFHVVGPYTLAHPTAYYAGNDASGSDQDPRAMVKEACLLAKQNNPELNFGIFDNDGDGLIDNCYIIYAGYSEASTANDDDMWPHSWYMGDDKFNIDGVTINNYSCSAELVGQPGLPLLPTMDGIGTFTHEFGHVLGLKDMYDTDDYVGGYGIDPGSYSLYASGSYNNNSRTPPYLMAFERMQLGWMVEGSPAADLKLLNKPEDVQLPSLATNAARYIDCQPQREAGTGRELMIVENRQKTGWDKYIPAHGLLIYHYDYTDEMVEKYWSVNGPNNNASHRCMYIKAADGSDDNTSRSGDTYPGSSANTEFTDTSVPNALNWAGKPTNVPLTNITEDDGLVRFQVMGGITTWTTVKTLVPTDVKDTSAVFTAVITADVTKVVESGFCWGSEEGLTIAQTHVVADDAKAPKVNINTLKPGTNYYVRAYLKLTDGTVVYGSSVPFRTECALAKAPFASDFSSWTNGELDCWRIVDNNRDGTSWEYDESSEGMLYYGDGYNDADDWLICRNRMLVPEHGSLYFMRGILDEGDVENLDIYISTKRSTLDDFVLYKRFSFADNYSIPVLEEVDLSEFAGKEIYVAFKCSSERLQSALYLWYFMLMDKLDTPTMKRFEKTGANQLTVEWTPVDRALYYYLMFGKESSERQFYSLFTPVSFYERIEGKTEVQAGSISFTGDGSVTLKNIPEGVLDLKFMLTSSGPFGTSTLVVQGSKDGERWTDVGPKISISSYDAEGQECDWEAYVANKGYTQLRFNFTHGGRNGRMRYLYLEYYDGKVIDMLAEGAVYGTSTVINGKTDGEFDSGRYVAWVCAGDGVLYYDESNKLIYDAATAIEDHIDDSGLRLSLTKDNLRVDGLQAGQRISVCLPSGVTLFSGVAEGQSLSFGTRAHHGVVLVNIADKEKRITRKVILP